MSGSYNRATLIGHLGGDPTSATTNDGRAVVSFGLATSESWTDKASGERRERTQWHRIVIFHEGLGKVATTYLRKGSKVMIEGQIQTRKYKDRAGVERSVTEIVLQAFGGTLLLLDGRQVEVAGARGGGGGSGGVGSGGGWGGASSGSADLDDDVPF